MCTNLLAHLYEAGVGIMVLIFGAMQTATSDGSGTPERSAKRDASPGRNDETIAGNSADIASPFSADANRFSPLKEGPPLVVPGYRIVREVSRGGQAVVCEAVQVSTGRKVAIKIMREGPLASARERARFDREVQVLAALNHPNIVRVVDRGTTGDGSFFLSMDYVGGPPLDEWLAQYYRQHPDGPPPSDPSELLRIFLKLCDAISAAHLRGIVHRDLKPANVRMDAATGEPVVLDFGLARTAISEMTDEQTPQQVSITGQFLGSLPWASPEQAEGVPEKIDVRTDVYSLGVILYQMLTGRFPYQVAGTMRDVLDNILNVAPSAPSLVMAAKEAREVKRRLKLSRKPTTGRLNPVIDAIVLKALAKRREDRYQSAGELARDIGNYLSGRPTLAGGAEPRRAMPWKLITATAIVLAVGVGGTVAFMRLGHGVPWLFHKSAESLAPTKQAVAPAILPAGPATQAVASVVDAGTGSASAPTQPIRASVARTASLDDWLRPWLESYKGSTTDPICAASLVVRPAAIPGVKNWTIETAGFRSGASAVQYSPDGKMIATGGNDGVIRLWNPHDKRLIRCLVGEIETIWRVAWSPDGLKLACCDGSGETRIWNVASGEYLRSLPVVGGARDLAWSHDGQRLAVASGSGSLVWNVSSGKQLDRPAEGMPGYITAVSWAPDDQRLYLGGGVAENQGCFGLFDPTGGTFSARRKLPGGTGLVRVSPDGKHIATLSNKVLETWDITGSEPTRTLPADVLSGLEWSPNSRQIAFAKNGGLVELNIETGALFGLNAAVSWGNTTSWSPDGGTIAAVTHGGETVAFIDAVKGLGDKLLQDSPLGVLPIVDLPPGRPVWGDHGSRLAMGLSGGGFGEAALVTMDLSPQLKSTGVWVDVQQGVLQWSKSDASILVTFAGPGLVEVNPITGARLRQIGSVAGWPILAPGSSLTAMVTEEKMGLWDGVSQIAGPPIPFETPVIGPDRGIAPVVEWSPDGQTLATLHRDGVLRFRDRHGTVTTQWQGEPITSFAWSHGGSVIALIRHEARLEVVDVKTRKVVLGAEIPGRQVAWSPDDRLLALNGMSTRELLLIDATSMKQVGFLKRPEDIRQPYFRPDGLLATFSDRGLIWFWNTTNGEPLGALLPSLRNGHVAVISRNGHLHGSPGAEADLVYVVQTDHGQETLRPAEFRKRYNWHDE